VKMLEFHSGSGDRIQSDVIIKVSFNADSVPAARSFLATEKLAAALLATAQALLPTLNLALDAVAILEDLRSSTLTSWFSFQARSTLENDEQEKSRIPCEYIEGATLAVLAWLQAPPEGWRLSNLKEDIRSSAQAASAASWRSYAPLSEEALLQIIRAWSTVTESLVPSESHEVTIGSGTVIVDAGLSIPPPDVLWPPEIVVSEKVELILIVEKPDYFGEGCWELRHGNARFSVVGMPRRWLQDFRERRIDVRPGDAIRCKVLMQRNYARGGEMTKEDLEILEILPTLVSNSQPYDENDLRYRTDVQISSAVLELAAEFRS
jgi:hypothetical protein